MKLSISIIEDNLMGYEWTFYIHKDGNRFKLSKSYKWFDTLPEIIHELRFLQTYLPKAPIYYEVNKQVDDKLFFDIEYNPSYGFAWRMLRKSTQQPGDILMSKCNKWFATMDLAIQEMEVIKMYLSYTEIDFNTIKAKSF